MNLDTNYLSRVLICFTIAFSTCLFLVTYLLHLPQFITQKPKIVQEYYQKNFTRNVLLDYGFVVIYFLIAWAMIKLLQVKKTSVKFLVVISVTALLTGGFCYYFLLQPKSSNFFSRWFHTVKYRSVVYDIVLLGLIYLVYQFMLDQIKSN